VGVNGISVVFCTDCGRELYVCGLIFFSVMITSYNLFVCLKQIDLCLEPKYRSVIMYTIECNGVSVN